MKIRQSLVTLRNQATLATVSALTFNVGTVLALTKAECDAFAKDGNIAKAAECTSKTDANPLFGEGGVFEAVTNAMLFLVGAISVIMLIVGGIRYVLSSGDQNAVTAAKNTILYAIIGIIVAFLAFGAVQFVTGQLTN